jgi:hypothetical protein
MFINRYLPYIRTRVHDAATTQNTIRKINGGIEYHYLKKKYMTNISKIKYMAIFMDINTKPAVLKYHYFLNKKND